MRAAAWWHPLHAPEQLPEVAEVEGQKSGGVVAAGQHLDAACTRARRRRTLPVESRWQQTIGGTAVRPLCPGQCKYAWPHTLDERGAGLKGPGNLKFGADVDVDICQVCEAGSTDLQVAERGGHGQGQRRDLVPRLQAAPGVCCRLLAAARRRAAGTPPAPPASPAGPGPGSPGSCPPP